jgi:hypothetical protein
MKAKYAVAFDHSHIQVRQFTGLSESQLIKTILEQGIHTVSSITHDADDSGDIRPVEGRELISIWKQVHRTIKHRKH